MPEGVPGLLSDIDVHRVRAGDPASLTHVTNIGRWQPFNANPPRFDSGERDLEIDNSGTMRVVLELSPKGEALPDENLRTALIRLAADRYFALNLREGN